MAMVSCRPAGQRCKYTELWLGDPGRRADGKPHKNSQPAGRSMEISGHATDNAEHADAPCERALVLTSSRQMCS